MEKLRGLLEDARPQLEDSLRAAELELEELKARQRELEELIARTRAALGVTVSVHAPPGAWTPEAVDPDRFDTTGEEPHPAARATDARLTVRREPAAPAQARAFAPEADHAGHVTLHEAIAIILRKRGNNWMTVQQIAGELDRTGLYRRKDGGTPETAQIHARTKNYAQMFEKDGPRIRLRQGG